MVSSGIAWILDEIQGMHILNLGVLVDHYLIEAEPHVKDDNFLSAADGGHIAPDLIVSAHCYDFYFHCGISWCCFWNFCEYR